MIIYIHSDANGTYLGNGGFVMLNALAHEMRGMGLTPAFYDHEDRLTPDMWDWLEWDCPGIVPYAQARAGTEPIITTWLYNWLPVLNSQPELWPRLRYWCSGELLRDERIHDPARAFVKAHCPVIAINNPALTKWYMDMSISATWQWTNWVSDIFEFTYNDNRPYDVGFVNDDEHETSRRLITRFGAEHVKLILGTRQEVVAQMRQCKTFLVWNQLWPMLPGLGESFGLVQYEAVAAGCATVGRLHCGNYSVHNFSLTDDFQVAFGRIANLIDFPVERERLLTDEWLYLDKHVIFDDARRAAIYGYLLLGNES